MDHLLITRSLAQALLDYITQAPTGTLPAGHALRLVSELQKLQPAPVADSPAARAVKRNGKAAPQEAQS
jgi:hypothetical protein